MGLEALMTSMLTTRDLQELMNVDRSTIYRMAESGKLPAIKVGRQWRFHKSILDEWFREHAATLRTTLLAIDV